MFVVKTVGKSNADYFPRLLESLEALGTVKARVKGDTTEITIHLFHSLKGPGRYVALKALDTKFLAYGFECAQMTCSLAEPSTDPAVLQHFAVCHHELKGAFPATPVRWSKGRPSSRQPKPFRATRAVASA